MKRGAKLVKKIKLHSEGYKLMGRIKAMVISKETSTKVILRFQKKHTDRIKKILLFRKSVKN